MASYLGHNAPVTLLKLDPLGKTLLSGDIEGRDRSIRLWDLTSGKSSTRNSFLIHCIVNFTGASLAVYTPTKQITACELTSNGKHVALALKNCSKLTTLELKGGDYSTQGSHEHENAVYGSPENEGKVFDLKD